MTYSYSNIDKAHKFLLLVGWFTESESLPNISRTEFSPAIFTSKQFDVIVLVLFLVDDCKNYGINCCDICRHKGSGVTCLAQKAHVRRMFFIKIIQE